MEFFLQSPLKMADIFPGLMMVTHGARISNCGLLAKWLKDSPTSLLPIQLRTNSHPDWFHVSPDLITIAQWTPHVVSTFLMYWTRIARRMSVTWLVLRHMLLMLTALSLYNYVPHIRTISNGNSLCQWFFQLYAGSSTGTV
jgi:hypothetical protein